MGQTGTLKKSPPRPSSEAISSTSNRRARSRSISIIRRILTTLASPDQTPLKARREAEMSNAAKLFVRPAPLDHFCALHCVIGVWSGSNIPAPMQRLAATGRPFLSSGEKLNAFSSTHLTLKPPVSTNVRHDCRMFQSENQSSKSSAPSALCFPLAGICWHCHAQLRPRLSRDFGCVSGWRLPHRIASIDVVRIAHSFEKRITHLIAPGRPLSWRCMRNISTPTSTKA